MHYKINKNSKLIQCNNNYNRDIKIQLLFFFKTSAYDWTTSNQPSLQHKANLLKQRDKNASRGTALPPMDISLISLVEVHLHNGKPLRRI